jgi:hypothetical protein
MVSVETKDTLQEALFEAQEMTLDEIDTLTSCQSLFYQTQNLRRPIEASRETAAPAASSSDHQ